MESECLKYELLCTEPGGHNMFWFQIKSFQHLAQSIDGQRKTFLAGYSIFKDRGHDILGTVRTMLFTNIMHKPTTLILLTTINTRGNVRKF